MTFDIFTKLKFASYLQASGMTSLMFFVSFYIMTGNMQVQILSACLMRSIPRTGPARRPGNYQEQDLQSPLFSSFFPSPHFFSHRSNCRSSQSPLCNKRRRIELRNLPFHLNGIRICIIQLAAYSQQSPYLINSRNQVVPAFFSIKYIDHTLLRM